MSALTIGGDRLVERLRSMLFSSVMKQDLSWFDKPANDVGRLTTKLASDAILVESATGMRWVKVDNNAVPPFYSPQLSFCGLFLGHLCRDHDVARCGCDRCHDLVVEGLARRACLSPDPVFRRCCAHKAACRLLAQDQEGL